MNKTILKILITRSIAFATVVAIASYNEIIAPTANLRKGSGGVGGFPPLPTQTAHPSHPFL
jgi:hypothetical protein